MYKPVNHVNPKLQTSLKGPFCIVHQGRRLNLGKIIIFVSLNHFWGELNYFGWLYRYLKLAWALN